LRLYCFGGRHYTASSILPAQVAAIVASIP
jgi:hypothetical protein